MLTFDTEMMKDLSYRLGIGSNNTEELICKLKILKNELLSDEQFALFDKSTSVIEKIDSSVTDLESNASRLTNLQAVISMAAERLEEISVEQNNSILQLTEHLSSVSKSVTSAATIANSDLVNVASEKYLYETDGVDIAHIDQTKQYTDAEYGVTNVETE